MRRGGCVLGRLPTVEPQSRRSPPVDVTPFVAAAPEGAVRHPDRARSRMRSGFRCLPCGTRVGRRSSGTLSGASRGSGPPILRPRAPSGGSRSGSSRASSRSRMGDAMTRFLAAYDTEMSGVCKPRPDVPSCLEASRRIVEVHRRHGMPATFFIVGRVLCETPEEFHALRRSALRGGFPRLVAQGRDGSPYLWSRTSARRDSRGSPAGGRIGRADLRAPLPGFGRHAATLTAFEGHRRCSGSSNVPASVTCRACSVARTSPCLPRSCNHSRMRQRGIPRCGRSLRTAGYENLLKGSNRASARAPGVPSSSLRRSPRRFRPVPSPRRKKSSDTTTGSSSIAPWQKGRVT